MNTLKPKLEKIEPGVGTSFSLKKFDSHAPNYKPFYHFHPELELVSIKKGSGKRHIGHHVSYYHDGDLIFIGPNLPHYGFTERLSTNNSEIVLQLKEDFLGREFFEKPEMARIKGLFERSRTGISFYGNTKEEVENRLEELFHLESYERIPALLQIFNRLAISTECQSLNVEGVPLVIQQQDNDRIEVIYDYVRQHFLRDITLDEIAELVNMTVPAFCRYFKKITHKTFISFVNEFRVVHACKLLSEDNITITEVCYESGFNNFSHFSNVFKKVTGKTPSEYRKEVPQLVI